MAARGARTGVQVRMPPDGGLGPSSLEGRIRVRTFPARAGPPCGSPTAQGRAAPPTRSGSRPPVRRDGDVARRDPVAGYQEVARRPAGIVNERCGGRPPRIVEDGRMQRPEDALEQILPAHRNSPATPCLRVRTPSMRSFALSAWARRRRPSSIRTSVVLPRGLARSRQVPARWRYGRESWRTCPILSTGRVVQ